MKKNKPKLVTISALALSAACYAPAWGQAVLVCTRPLDIGAHFACGNGSLTINPDGSTSLVGCLVTTRPPTPGRCLLSTGGVPPLKKVAVDFTNAGLTIKAGTASATIKLLRMYEVGGTKGAKAKLTFSPTEAGNGVTLDIGGRLNFSAGQTLGVYTGSVSITAN